MHTLSSAAILLANTNSVECTGPLLVELGFTDELVSLDQETRDRIGITSDFDDGHTSLGPGAMRALVAYVKAGHALREVIGRLAGRLSSRTPHIMWTLILLQRESRQIAIAAWYSGRTPPRVVALLASQDKIVDSDSETLCAMADATSDSDIATHSRWLEILGRETVSRNFFRAMQNSVAQLAGSLSPSLHDSTAPDLALLCLSRLLFLSFLETKGWLDGDHAFLANQFAGCMMAGGKYHYRVLAPLFFGTLNTRPANRAQRAKKFGRVPFLNGGLFSRSAIERIHSHRHFSDEALGDVFGQLLTRYRFTASEDSSVWSEAAVDPEMLGKAFEGLMAAPDRKTTGAFYTPQMLVEQVTTSALESGIHGSNVDVRVLDPACGSGAFLVHIMERLAALRVHLGDSRPIHLIRREILTRSIFGVDINPTAVWLCELRLWLSTAIQDPERDPMKVAALPNLDRNIRVGDSLAGGSFHDSHVIPRPTGIASARARYTRAVGPRKIAAARVLDRLERECAIASLDSEIIRLAHARRELIGALRSPDLFGQKSKPSLQTELRLKELKKSIHVAESSRRGLKRGGALPFSFETQFADIGATGGFDVVVGNPPWVRLHNVDHHAKALFAREFATFRESAWQSGADAASAGRGFAAQVDLAALFTERGVSLARRGGSIALLVPAKLWRSLAGGGIRSHLLTHCDVTELHDLTESPQLFEAAVYPSIVVARRKPSLSNEPTMPLRAGVHHGTSLIQWPLCAENLSFDNTAGSPWLILPPEVRAAFDCIRAAGIPLAKSTIGRPLLGVKTGCNEAFVVRPADVVGLVERDLLRPLHRGETIRRWKLAPPPEQIIWTHDKSGPLGKLPPHATQWLGRWRRELELRTDARGKAPWWRMFRTESAIATSPRVAWSDFGKSPRAAVLEANDPTVLLNSCYVARCSDLTDAYTLAAILNSPVVAAWLNALAEPARGGYRRYLGWTVALMPVPIDWARARRLLAPLAERAALGEVPGADALLDATLRAYRIHESDVEPLLLWNSR
ncbi:MAG: Eco57I restriction-modification methylase domain-containing protein [Gemmatimonadaceae bacterium]